MKISSKREKNETTVSTLPSVRNLRGAKKSNFLVTMGALVCAVMMSSCSVNDDIEYNNDNGAVRFTAGIAQVATPQGAPVTKAAGTTWANGDAIGIFMAAHGGTTNVLAENKKYTTTGSSSFTPASGEEIFYPQAGAVDFIAYYPWKTGYTLGTAINVEINTTQTTENQPTFDLLRAKADNSGNGYNKGDAVALTFDHMLARIEMTIVKPSTINPNNTGLTDADLTGMTVTVTGMNTTNTFDLSAGTWGLIPDAEADITPRTITDAEAYDAIILPGSYAAGDVTVEFTIKPNTPDEETFVWTLPVTNFAGGNEYPYDVTITRTGVQATGTIRPWTNNNRQPGTAE